MHTISGRIAVSLAVAVFVWESAAAAGWPQSHFGSEGTPTFYDLDGDGRAEVIVPAGGSVNVYDLAGDLSLEWAFGPSFSAETTPAIADLDGDGSPEVVLSAGGFPPQVYLFDAHGHLQPGWPVTLPGADGGSVSAPALVDLDRDGFLDIAVEAPNGVFAFKRDGSALPGWPFLWPTEPFSSAAAGIAAADLEGDGFVEIVATRPALPDRGLYVLRSDGTLAPGWPRPIEFSRSAPGLADLDGDGRLEIVVQEGDPGSLGNRVHVFRYDGASFPGWPRTFTPGHSGSRSSPAIADVNGDGTLEIVATDGDGTLYVFEPDGSSYPGFPFAYGGVSVLSSPSVIDVDGDGFAEIFLQYNPVSNVNTQVVTGWHLDGSVLPGFPQTLVSSTNLTTAASTHVADADGDGDYELVVGATLPGGGLTWVVPIPSSASTLSAEAAGWPRVHHDARNRGCRCAEKPPNRNLPPIASAGPDRQSECGPANLDGSNSTDADSTPGKNDDIIAFDWLENFGQPSQTIVGSGEELQVVLSPGVHTITLRVTDSTGNIATDEVVWTITNTGPPVVSVALTPSVLWPPNHRMVDVTASIVHGCGVATIVLASVSSNEPDDAPGRKDGSTVDDIQGADIGTADFRLALRAERASDGNGRIYTVVYTATDPFGNSTSATALVVVPLDNGGHTDPLSLSLEATAGGTLIRWNLVPDALSFDVVRGRLRSIAEGSSAISLGQVVCVANDTLGTSTSGGEDAEVPEPGEGFFYLVQYSDGTNTSYGADTAAKPRVPGSGDCGP